MNVNAAALAGSKLMLAVLLVYVLPACEIGVVKVPPSTNAKSYDEMVLPVTLPCSVLMTAMAALAKLGSLLIGPRPVIWLPLMSRVEAAAKARMPVAPPGLDVVAMRPISVIVLSWMVPSVPPKAPPT